MLNRKQGGGRSNDRSPFSTNGQMTLSFPTYAVLIFRFVMRTIGMKKLGIENL